MNPVSYQDGITGQPYLLGVIARFIDELKRIG
jgi:hypothetical protein